eukprot:61667-Pelagomonas_calceolata.AAC.5
MQSAEGVRAVPLHANEHMQSAEGVRAVPLHANEHMKNAEGVRAVPARSKQGARGRFLASIQSRTRHL